MTALQLCKKKMVKNSSSAISANNSHSLITSTSSMTAPGQPHYFNARFLVWAHACAEWGIESQKKGNPADESENCISGRWEEWCAQEGASGKAESNAWQRANTDTQRCRKRCSPTTGKVWLGKGCPDPRYWGSSVCSYVSQALDNFGM